MAPLRFISQHDFGTKNRSGKEAISVPRPRLAGAKTPV
jgi:hypothetical protein